MKNKKTTFLACILALFTLTSTFLTSTANIAKAEVSIAEFSKLMGQYLGSEAGRKSLGDAFVQYQKDLQSKQVENYISELMKKKRENVDPASSYFKGNKNAKVTLVEFADFRCGHCRNASDTVKQLLKNYKDKLKVVYKNRPVLGADSRQAALAALAAGEQGKFWEYHDKLFSGQVSASVFEKYAKQLGLNVEKFKTDMASKKVKDLLKSEEDQAKKLAINGTPAFVANGVVIRGALPYKAFVAIIDKLIKE